MLGSLNALMSKLRHSPEPESDEPTPPKCRWVIDLPLIGGKRLGAFRTKEDALDARREYIIQKLMEHSTPKAGGKCFDLKATSLS